MSHATGTATILPSVLLLLFVLWVLWRFAANPDAPRLARAKRAGEPESKGRLCRPKPPWVRREVLRLKALMPHDGCRTIALTFRLLHGHRETVGKTFVAEAIRRSALEILRLRREIKHRKPRPLPRNLIWGLDLTFLPGRRLPVLAILDHGTRALILFEEIRTRSAITVARAIIQAAKKYGLPRYLRTDNEPNLCALALRAALFLLGVRHQRTLPHCPWQNGRIERFFATFKKRALPRLAALREARAEPEGLQPDLDTFRLWYNHARPHQHLDGRTPAEAWDGRGSVTVRRRRRARLLCEWEGLLVGYVRR